MMETILSRAQPFYSPQNLGQTPFQTSVDDLTLSFIAQATNVKNLAAMMMGGTAYQLGRMGVMGMGSSVVLRPFSVVVGLGSEVTAFEFTNRALNSLSVPANLKPAPMPNLWTWSGPGGWREGLETSAISFGLLKSAGFLGRQQNEVFQHLFQSTAMVAGHNAAGFLGIVSLPEGSLAEQLLHAEVTNLQARSGLGLGHVLTGGRLLAIERGLDFSIRSGEIDFAARAMKSLWPSLRSPSLEPAGQFPFGDVERTSPSELEKVTKKPPILLMSTKDDSEPGRGKIIQPPKDEERSEFEVGGLVDLRQFYGKGGGSDADTVKLKLEPSHLQWRGSSKDSWKNLSPDFLLKGAHVMGRPVLDAEGRITLRLQGVDAPELHYPASPVEPLENASERCQARWENGLFRQYGGYRATLAVIGMLSTYVTKGQADKIKARAHAWIDSPSDLFDVYGRFVSELLLGSEGESLNLWLLKKGWALPAFYTSMSASEIETLRKASAEARKKDLGLWPRYRDRLVPFNPEIRLPRKEESPLVAKKDEGSFHLPKLFRRQVHFEVNRRAGLLRLRSLHSFLEERAEYWLPTEDYLRGTTSKGLHTLDELIDSSGKVLYDPEEMVFVERKSSLLDSKGKKILSFGKERSTKSRR